jgi:hypothetical protein
MVNDTGLYKLIGTIGEAPKGDGMGKRKLRFRSQQQVDRFCKAVGRLSKLSPAIHTSKHADAGTSAPKHPKTGSHAPKVQVHPKKHTKSTSQKANVNNAGAGTAAHEHSKGETHAPKAQAHHGKQLSWAEIHNTTSPAAKKKLLAKAVEDKKKPCKYHEAGKCFFGSHCKYSHGKAESQAGAPAKPCWQYAKGKCHRGSDCKYSHEVKATKPSRRPLCYSWNKTGDCERGDSCIYHHRKICLDFAKGKCEYKNCKFLHPTDRA